ncbi:FAD-dependent monooxygenase [Streptomyces canus]|uniref:FAD-dependent monooxygenase n=1 Tax=Streptomyces canus TaxID=58343 RepID=UPI0022596F9F|nr:FAD-dependent monooxygenase [Streptomyces canus]MCX4857780.1 FAD-dependent monooxygenase [Streptomyces canus]
MLDVGVIGGGPGGLFLARLLLMRGIADRVHVRERNPVGATFGFGIVFSDRTMSALRAADPETHDRIVAASRSWRDMEVRVGGRELRYGGYGFTAIARRTLLDILQEQALASGARIDHLTEADAADLCAEHQLVVAADGVGSATRSAREGAFGTKVEEGSAKFVWYGTTAPTQRVTFPFVKTAFGVFAAHTYPFADGISTFIVETDEQAWRAAGMDVSTERVNSTGGSDEYSQQLMEEVFADHLKGHPLLVNNSRWANFRVVRNRVWWHDNLVLLGDAAHTAHFSVGSGTKLAMEDAIGLTDALGEWSGSGGRRTVTPADLAPAFKSYEEARRPEVARTQRLAAPSMRWWETFAQRVDRDPARFGFHFLTRTPAISLAGLRRRHPERIAEAESAFVVEAGSLGVAAAGSDTSAVEGSTPHASAFPLRLGETILRNRMLSVVPPSPGQSDVCVAHALTGNSLVLADWSGSARQHVTRVGPAAGEEWRTAVHEAGLAGASIGAVVSGEGIREQPPGRLLEMPVLVLLLDEPTPGTFARTVAALPPREAGRQILIGLTCPDGPPTRQYADQLSDCASAAASAGAAGIHLRLPEPAASTESAPGVGEDPWTVVLELADRLRTESGLPLIIDAAGGWALDAPGHTADNWPARLHTALVAGRVDAVASFPLTPSTR